MAVRLFRSAVSKSYGLIEDFAWSVLRDRQEHFRIHKVRRVYDRSVNKFAFNISYETAVQLTPRTMVVAEAFGLGVDEERKFPVLNAELGYA